MSENNLHTKQTNISENKNIPVDALVSPPISLTTNEDCMDMMSRYPNKFFELAVVDPPYGININNAGWIKQQKQANPHTNKNWDNEAPNKEYFDELFRVSKNQIIWGGNYFLDYLYANDGLIIWDKMNGTNPLADAEIAWKSLPGTTRIFRMHHFSEGYDKKIHPTQKPTKLYRWLLNRYAAAGDLILDTHVGSGSSIVACIEGGFSYYGCEIDKEYYEAAKKRIGRAFRKYELEFADEAV